MLEILHVTSYSKIQIAGGDTAQPLALRKRLRFIRRHFDPACRRLLDCGCGAGEYVFYLVEHYGLDAHGVEHDIEKVRHAQSHPQHGYRITQGDLQALTLESGSWDYAMLNEVLEHVPDERAALHEVHRVLKPGGLLFVFAPNRWFPFETHGVRLKRSGRRVPNWIPLIPYIPLGLSKHIFSYWARNYWHRELRRMLTDAGFSIIETSYVWQTFEGISGNRSRFFMLLRPMLRGIANLWESLPFLKCFGVSQFVVCRK